MTKLELGDTTLLGQSRAGLGTTVVMKERKLCFDLGVDLREALNCRDFFITHGHTDHLGAIFNHLSVRKLESRNLATFYVPPSIGDDLRSALSAWKAVSGSVFEYRIFEVFPGASVPLKNGLSVSTFPLAHSPECQGYLLEESVQKLQPRFQDLPPSEIVRRKTAGDPELFYTEKRPQFAYVGDTLPAGIDQMPEEAWQARILMMEATFLDEQKPMEKVRKGKHLHVDDIAERIHSFQGEYLVLYHFSQLYKRTEIAEIVLPRFPESVRDRIRLFV